MIDLEQIFYVRKRHPNSKWHLTTEIDFTDFGNEYVIEWPTLCSTSNITVRKSYFNHMEMHDILRIHYPYFTRIPIDSNDLCAQCARKEIEILKECLYGSSV